MYTFLTVYSMLLGDNRVALKGLLSGKIENIVFAHAYFPGEKFCRSLRVLGLLDENDRAADSVSDSTATVIVEIDSPTDVIRMYTVLSSELREDLEALKKEPFVNPGLQGMLLGLKDGAEQPVFPEILDYWLIRSRLLAAFVMDEKAMRPVPVLVSVGDKRYLCTFTDEAEAERSRSRLGEDSICLSYSFDVLLNNALNFCDGIGINLFGTSMRINKENLLRLKDSEDYKKLYTNIQE